MIDLKQFFSAMATIEEEKGISHEVMVDTIESAIATAYKKDYRRKGADYPRGYGPRHWFVQAISRQNSC